MSERSGSFAPDDRNGPAGEVEQAGTPPLAPDLAGVGAGYTWKFGEGGQPPAPGTVETTAEGESAEETELQRLQARVRLLTAALEDVVALALSGADYKERAIMMHRRAVAALSGTGAKPGSDR